MRAKQKDSTTTERLIPRKGAGRIRLERFWIAPGDQKTWRREGEESLYFLLDARGSLAINALGAQWKHDIRPDLVLWVPGGLEHTFKNSGDAPLRGIVFSSRIAEIAPDRGKKQVGGPMIWDLQAIQQKIMVSFLSRPILSSANMRTKAFHLSEYQIILPGGHVPDHTHESRDEVGYLCKGSGYLSFKKNRRVVSAGEAFHIPAGAQHSMSNEGEEVVEYLIVQTCV